MSLDIHHLQTVHHHLLLQAAHRHLLQHRIIPLGYIHFIGETRVDDEIVIEETAGILWVSLIVLYENRLQIQILLETIVAVGSSLMRII
jgi:hypothetical protein